MNKFMIIAALALAGSPALASKARVGALNNSRQLVDVQYTFERPYLLSSVGELAIIEWGQAQPTGTAVAAHAEGGFIKKNGDSYFGLYLGRKSDDFSTGIRAIAAGLLEEQNPINLLFASKTGDYSWGVNLKYSNGSNDTGSKKVSTSGIALGATNGKWQGEFVLGLSGKSEQTLPAAVTAESKGNMKLTVGYLISDMMQSYVDYKQVKSDITTGAGTQSPETTSMHLGFINTIVKNDDANFFYGVAYSSSKTDGTTTGTSEITALPVWMGIEANATSWMVFRASLQQNVILNETKAVGGTKTDLDSVAFAGGAGIKLGKGLLDVSFGTAATNGNLDFASAGFLAQTAYTYTF